MVDPVPLYAPPEVAYGTSESIETSADIYCLGAMFLLLLFGDEEYLRAWRTRDLSSLRQVQCPDTKPFLRLLLNMTSVEPEDRPNAESVVSEVMRIAKNIGVKARV